MLSLAIIIVAQACQKTKSVSMEESEGILYPIGFPPLPSPKDNQYTKNRFNLVHNQLLYNFCHTIYFYNSNLISSD